MIIIENFIKREATPEEIAAYEDEVARYEMEQRKRPLTESEVSRMLITEQINTLDVDDQTALRMIDYYPTFESLVAKPYTAEKIGFKFTYSGLLYKTAQTNYEFVSHYVPGVGTESLFTRIDEEHDGSKYDPVPYNGNMALENGKYYIQDGIIYLCNRDTGAPVYNALKDLVDIYVVAA